MFSLWAVEVSRAYSPEIMIQCTPLLFDQDFFSLLALTIAMLQSYAFLLVLPKIISILRIFFLRAANGTEKKSVTSISEITQRNRHLSKSQRSRRWPENCLFGKEPFSGRLIKAGASYETLIADPFIRVSIEVVPQPGTACTQCWKSIKGHSEVGHGLQVGLPVQLICGRTCQRTLMARVQTFPRPPVCTVIRSV